MENHQNTSLTSFLLCFSMILTKYNSFTSLYNGFVDLFMKYTSYTSLYNGFVDSGDMMLQPGEAPEGHLDICSDMTIHDHI